jgi:hypothetical protein
MFKSPRTRQEIDGAVVRDILQYKGKLVETYEVYAYREGRNHNLRLTSPAIFRVGHPPESDLYRWCYQWCDPIWPLTLAKSHPELRGYSSFWIHGPSYELGTGKVEPIFIRLISSRERFWLSVRTLGGLLKPITT